MLCLKKYLKVIALNFLILFLIIFSLELASYLYLKNTSNSDNYLEINYGRNFKQLISDLSDRSIPSSHIPNSGVFDSHNNTKFTILEDKSRLTPRKFLEANTAQTILLLGCSYTFGTGVNDNETIPYYLGEKLENTKILNFGVPGSGPSDTLYKIQYDSNNFSISQNEEVIGVYILVGDHVNRVSNNFSHFMWAPFNIPVFRLNKSKNDIEGGLLLNDAPLSYFLSVLYKSSYTSSLVLNIFDKYSDQTQPPDPSEELLTTLVLKKMEQEFYKKFPNGKFLVFTNLIKSNKNPLIKNLEKHNVTKCCPIPNDYKGPEQLEDGHLSPNGNQQIANELLQALSDMKYLKGHID